MYLRQRQNSSGFMLVELIIRVILLVVTIGVVLSIGLFGRSSNLLNAEVLRLKNALEFSRQQSIAAYKGETYGIRLDPPNQFTLLPSNTTKDLRVTITSPSTPRTIFFNKITGYPGQHTIIELESGPFIATIEINSLGIITSTSPKQK